MPYDLENTSGRELSMSRVLDAPVDLVWEVWTNPDHIKNWWGPTGFTNTISKMDVSEGGEWLFIMHGAGNRSFRNRIIYRKIEPLIKIIFEHFNPDYMATVMFEPIGKQTRMKWTMVFETDEMFETLVKTFKADEGFKQNGEKLENYLLQLVSQD